MRLTYARCQVMLELAAGGPLALQLNRGSLLQPAHPGDPWFCLVADVRLGVGGTCITDAECCDPGAIGNVRAGALVAVAGYPSNLVRVTSFAGTGGADPPGGVFVDDGPRQEAIRKWSSSRYEEAARLGEREELAALVRMNLGIIDQMMGFSQLPYDAADRRGIHGVFIMGDAFANVARLMIGYGGVPMLAMGFINARLVYFSNGGEPKLNKLPGNGLLFLPSESTLFLPKSRALLSSGDY